jgi:hypothetical protein
MDVNKTASSANSAMPVSPEILPVLAIFLNAFTAPTRKKYRLLLWEPCSHAAEDPARIPNGNDGGGFRTHPSISSCSIFSLLNAFRIFIDLALFGRYIFERVQEINEQVRKAELADMEVRMGRVVFTCLTSRLNCGWRAGTCFQ